MKNYSLFALAFSHFFFSLMKRKSSQKEKSRRAPAQAKTPSQRLNGNELAALKQISVLTAFALVFLNACSAEANLTFSGCLLRFAGKGAFLLGSPAASPSFFKLIFTNLLIRYNVMEDLKTRIDAVKDRVDIRSVVGEWVSLSVERGGKSTGLCPFHGDHHPSLSVNSNKKIFKCFSCGEGGNVFAFVMRKEGCSFYEALLRLEARAGISAPSSLRASSTTSGKCGAPSAALSPLPTTSPTLSSPTPLSPATSPLPTPSSSTTSSLEASSTGTSSLEESMAPSVLAGGGLFGDLREREGGAPAAAPSEEVVRKGLLEGNAWFLRFLQGYDPGCAGLGEGYLNFEVGVAPKDFSFRGPAMFKGMLDRVVFPMRDAEGVLVGFSARHRSAVPPSGKWGAGCPKYVNSASSVLFRKRELLYGLHLAKKAIRRFGYAVLVEGYKDVIAMHVAGFTNTVGLCGLELTADHVDLLAGLCTRVVLLTDGDERGQAAVPKLEGVLKAAGFDTLALALPPGEDPDSLFRSLSGPGLVTLIRSLMLPPEGKTGPLQELPVSQSAALSLVGPCEELPAAAEIALPTAAEQEGEVVSDIDRLVATLPFVSRPGERMAVLIRINCLKEKLDTVSTALGRPPAVF